MLQALENESGEGFRRSHPRAFRLHAMVKDGQNVQRFLVGRQFFVVFVVFLIAQLTTFRNLDLGLPEWLHVSIIDTGLAGALFTLCFGQLVPQLVASTHPMLMMGFYGAYEATRLCITLEWLGICQASWVIKRAMLGDEPQQRHCDDVESEPAKEPQVDSRPWVFNGYPTPAALAARCKSSGELATPSHEDRIAIVACGVRAQGSDGDRGVLCRSNGAPLPFATNRPAARAPARDSF